MISSVQHVGRSELWLFANQTASNNERRMDAIDKSYLNPQLALT